MNISILYAIIISVIFLMLLSIKWSLPIIKSSLIIITSTVVSLLISLLMLKTHISSHIISILFLASQVCLFGGMVFAMFYRDPERNPPRQKEVVVSPADGKIVYVKKLEAGDILMSVKNKALIILDELNNTRIANAELWQIGISMSFLDVHVNRSPIAGTVTLMHHRPGAFLSLRKKESLNLNERQTMVIEKDNIGIILVQIASRLVRRIEAYIHQGETIKIGQRIGMIKFGSQVDIFTQANTIKQVHVQVNDRVIAGETVLFSLYE